MESKWKNFFEYCMASFSQTCDDPDSGKYSPSVFLLAGGDSTPRMLQSFGFSESDNLARFVECIHGLEGICLVNILLLYGRYVATSEPADTDLFDSGDCEAEQEETEERSQDEIDYNEHREKESFEFEKSHSSLSSKAQTNKGDKDAFKRKIGSVRNGRSERLCRRAKGRKQSDSVSEDINSVTVPTNQTTVGIKSKGKSCVRTALSKKSNKQKGEEKLVRNSHSSTEKKASRSRTAAVVCDRSRKIDKDVNGRDITENIVEEPDVTIPRVCAVCSQTFSSSGSLLSHWKTHEENGGGVINTGKAFLCTKCSQTFKSYYLLKLHHRVHTGARPHSCEKCGKKFRLKQGLVAHLKTHGPLKPFKCDTCPATFVEKRLLNFHQLTHTGERSFVCEECGKAFVTLGNLKVHLRVHSGEKPFQCTICEKSFTQSSTLKTHMRIHKGDKQFRCDFCGWSFVRKSHLTTHLLTHTGNRPFKCDQCNYRGSTMSYLRKHSLIHTTTKPFKCEKCTAAFKRKSHLTAHAMTHLRKKIQPCKASSNVALGRNVGDPHQCRQFERKQVSQLLQSDIPLPTQHQYNAQGTHENSGQQLLPKSTLTTAEASHSMMQPLYQTIQTPGISQSQSHQLLYDTAQSEKVWGEQQGCPPTTTATQHGEGVTSLSQAVPYYHVPRAIVHQADTQPIQRNLINNSVTAVTHQYPLANSHFSQHMSENHLSHHHHHDHQNVTAEPAPTEHFEC